MDAVGGQLIPALPTCPILAVRIQMFLYDHNFLPIILLLWAPSFKTQISKTLLSNYIEHMTILYGNKMHKNIKQKSLGHLHYLPIFGPKFDPSGPLFLKIKIL